MSDWWEYDQLESGYPYEWHPAGKGTHPDDNMDFHIDLGAGRLPKGRLKIDRHGDADILMDLDTLQVYEMNGQETIITGMPFPDNSIKSIISHHCLEHIGNGFLRLMDECYRILEPGGKFRIIVPLFPSISAISDQDHKRYFCIDTFEAFCAVEGQPFWSDSFAEPYTKARFKLTHKNYTQSKTIEELENNPDKNGITIDDLFMEPREIRVTLQK